MNHSIERVVLRRPGNVSRIECECGWYIGIVGNGFDDELYLRQAHWEHAQIMLPDAWTSLISDEEDDT